MFRILLALFTLAAAAPAQTVTGTLEGHVTDSTGAVIPGAEVVASNAATGLTRRSTTNAEGFYQLTFLPVGDYTLTATAAGFGPVQRRAVVQLAATHAADFSLKPANVATEVTVMADAVLIETARGEVKGSVSEREIEDRPLPSRNILSLVEQLPGFQSSGGFSGVNNPTLSSGSYVAFNGTGTRSATFQIDGVNNDDSSEGSNRQNVNVSSIKEFIVLTNAYSAEHGRAGGAVVLVQTKSGTNAWHGDAYEFLQNDKLNSNSFFNNAAGRKPDGLLVAPRNAYRRNQFGYTIGGPILKNKLFLFHSLEQTKLIQYANARTFLPPIRTVQIGNCRLCVNPDEHPGTLERDVAFVQSILDRFPKGEPNATSLCPTCFIGQVRHDFPDQDYSGKLDWNAREKDHIALRYQYSRQKRRPGAIVEGTAAHQNHKQQNLGLTQTHIFSPSTAGEFRFGLGLRTTLVDISTGNDTPIISIAVPFATTVPTIGSAGAFPIHRYQTDYQYVYNLSHVRGRHVLKTGVDYRNQHLDDLADNFSRGWYRFNLTGTGATRYEGYENLLRGYLPAYERGYGNLTTFNRMKEINWYAMDDFKLTPTVTLNLGVRIEHVQKPTEVDDRILYEFNDFTAVQPRFGFAWVPNPSGGLMAKLVGQGRTSIRGGFGLFHNRIFQSIFTQGGASLRSLPPYGIYKAFEATFNLTNPDNGFIYTPAADPGRISIAQVAPDLRLPMVQQYNLTIDRQLSNDFALSVGYNRTRGIGLLQNAVLNRARFPQTDPVTGILYDKIDPDPGNTNPAPGFISTTQPRVNQRRPDARYNAITYINNGAWSYYNGLRVELKKRYSSGLHFSVAYALSKTIDTGSDVSQTSPLTEFDSARSQRGLSDFDQRHRLNLNYSYRLPWFNDGRGWKRQLLGGWKISGNNTYASGNPFTVTAGYDVNADGQVTDRPVLIDPSLFGASVDDGRQDAQGAYISTLQLPASGFFPNRLVAARDRLFDPGGSGAGTIGRNTFFGSGIKNWDLGLWKTFAFFERHELAFRGEMYNVTNSPRFAFPQRNLQSIDFGRITSTYNPMNFVGAGRADDTSRVVQLALRYVF